MLKKRMIWISAAMLLIAMLMAACSTNEPEQGQGNTPPGQSEQKPEPAKPPEPVTLSLYANQPMNPEDFNMLIVEPLKAKHPHITVELKSGVGYPAIQAAITAGDPIDLFTYFHGNWGDVSELDLAADLTPLVQTRKYDLARFDTGALRTLQELTGNNELPGLPYHMQFNALYYNKDIFDRFGVSYPKDGMTWEDAIALARTMTRTVDGVQYRGMSMDVWTRLTLQQGVLPVNAATNKSAVTSEPFNKALTIAKQLYSIPGNDPIFGANGFVKDRIQAMFGGVSNTLFDLLKTDMNWDVAQFPSYSDRLNTFTQYDLHVMGISKTSKHKEAAMDVLALFMSDEVQKLSTSKTGRVSPLADPAFQTYFGSDNPELKNKKIASIFKSKPATPAAKFTKWHSKSYQLANVRVMEFLQDKKDMNTALREADEEINQWIASNP